MISFWDRVWAVNAMAIRDYFREREAQRKRWADFCQKCAHEIIDECTSIAQIVTDATSKQAGTHVHKDLYDGIIQLPLYGFYLVLSRQNGIVNEQLTVLDLFFDHFNIPYTKNQFLEATRIDNQARRDMLALVGISEQNAGRFWVQFFKVLYRTDEDTSNISKLIDAFSSITMRFAAISGKAEAYLLEVLSVFYNDVHNQSAMCRLLPDDTIDLFGDAPFIEHFNRFKEDTFKVCRMTMDEDDEDLNPRDFFQGFSLGIIYQVVKRCTRNRADKIIIMDDILPQIETGSKVDGAYIFTYMEDYDLNNTSMLAAMMHVFTDLEGGNPSGWIMLTRFSGTYNLQTGKDIHAVEEAMNFIIGLENYLADKYPMSGFGDIASRYAGEVANIINLDIEKNVTIVEDDRSRNGVRATVVSAAGSNKTISKKKSIFERLFGG